MVENNKETEYAIVHILIAEHAVKVNKDVNRYHNLQRGGLTKIISSNPGAWTRK